MLISPENGGPRILPNIGSDDGAEGISEWFADAVCGNLLVGGEGPIYPDLLADAV